MNQPTITQQLKQQAKHLGFELAGVCPASKALSFERFLHWLDAGYAGKMDYIARRAAAYEHPRNVLQDARSLVMLGMSYSGDAPQPPQTGQGRVARYAWGTRDYHDVIRKRLKLLSAYLVEQLPDCHVRGVVDTAPLLEGDYAVLAGLGWVGKNTLLLNKERGSWLFLAALLTDAELEYDTPFKTDHCGTCQACLDACPTNAFPQPYVLDATRCISYLTIELREDIPENLRSGIDNWLFGCDICQEVCPWNQHAPQTDEKSFLPADSFNPIELTALFDMDDEAFRKQFRQTPLWRSKRKGILRNAAIVMGNHRSPSAQAALHKGLNDPEPLVRSACAWALGRYANLTARQELANRLEVETSPHIRREIQSALQGA
jgi:epoxyqueuosine reductase